MDYKLTKMETDELKELINIGASHASTALNQLTGKRVNITITKVDINRVENAFSLYSGKEKISTTIIMKVFGGATGIIFFLLHGNNSYKLARLLTKSKNKVEYLTSFDRSALNEIGNILAGSFLSVFSKFAGITVVHSISEIVTDTLSSIVNSIMGEVGSFSDVVLTFKIKLIIRDENIETELYFLMAPGFTGKILNMTRKKLKEKK